MMKLLRLQGGMSLIELTVGLALVGIVVLGAYTLVTNVKKTEQFTENVNLADTEFATGLLVAQNPAHLAPHVKLTSLGSCLRAESGSNCDRLAFTEWTNLKDKDGAKPLPFNAYVTRQGECGKKGITCPVERTMRYRWICKATSCTELEVEVSVVSHAKDKKGNWQEVRKRASSVKIDRRRFADRGNVKYSCDSGRQAVVGVDYDLLVDRCGTVPVVNCANPLAFYQPGGSANCRTPFSESCGNGFTSIGLHKPAIICN